MAEPKSPQEAERERRDHIQDTSRRLVPRAGERRDKPLGKYKALTEGYIANGKQGASTTGLIAKDTEFYYGGVPGSWMEPLDGAAEAAVKERADKIAERDEQAETVQRAAFALGQVART